MAEVLEREAAGIAGISTVAGRYAIGDQPMHPGLNMFACRLRAISAAEFVVTAPVIPTIGERVRASFGPFGSLSGKIARHLDDGFAVAIAHAGDGRAELVARIASFRERPWTGTRERRMDHRFMPGEPRSVIGRPDGWAQPCLIVDYSASGAAVSAAFQPAVGEVVTIGQVTAEVVRLFDVGFAVRFFERQDPEEIESLLEAPEEWRSAARRAVPARDPVDPAEVYGADG